MSIGDIPFNSKLLFRTMPDINCKKCGEPWGIYSLRNEVPEWEGEPDDAYDKVASGVGCPTCDWGDKAGDVSRSRTESDEQLAADHLKSLMRNTDDDPMKYI